MTGPKNTTTMKTPLPMPKNTKFFPLEGHLPSGEPVLIGLEPRENPTIFMGWTYTPTEAICKNNPKKDRLVNFKVGFDERGHIRVEDGKGEFNALDVPGARCQDEQYLNVFFCGDNPMNRFELNPDGTIQVLGRPTHRLGVAGVIDSEIDRYHQDHIKPGKKGDMSCVRKPLGIIMVSCGDERVMIFDTPLQENKPYVPKKN